MIIVVVVFSINVKRLLAQVAEEAGERVTRQVAAVLAAREPEAVAHLVVRAHALERLHPPLAPQQLLEHHEQRLALLPNAHPRGDGRGCESERAMRDEVEMEMEMEMMERTYEEVIAKDGPHLARRKVGRQEEEHEAALGTVGAPARPLLLCTSHTHIRTIRA
jgi:hypothetical protein